MSELHRAAKSAFLIIAITLASKLLGFIREVVIAAGFGASFYTDAYVVALTIPAVLFASFSRALQTTFIPVFSELLYQKEKEEAFSFAGSALNVVAAVVTLFSGGIYLFMPQVTHIISPGFQGPVYDLTVSLARIMLPAGIFWGLIGICSGALNSLNVFVPTAAVGIIYNLLIIGSVFTLGRSWGIAGLALGTACGVAGQLGLLIPWLRKTGFKWRFKLNLNHPALKKMGLLMIPVLAGSVVVQLNVVVDRLLASHLPEGSIAALNFANRLNGFVLGTFVFAFVTVLFPALSQKAAAGAWRDYQEIFFRGLKIIFYLTAPATAVILVLKVPMIRLLFERGAFNVHDTLITAIAFLYYGIGLSACGMREMINVAFYAIQDTRTPMMGGIACLLLNIGLNLLLVGPMAHGGLALATSLAVSLYVVVMLVLLFRRMQWKNGKKILLDLAKIAAASVAAGLAMEGGKVCFTGLTAGSSLQQAASVGGIILLGGVVYLIFSLVLKIEEIRIISEMIREEFRKIRIFH